MRLLDHLPNEISKTDIRIHKMDKTISTSGAVTNRAIKIMLADQDYDVIGFGDPDCIYHPDWLQISIKLMRWLQEKHKVSGQKIGMISSYNSKSKDFHNWIDVNEWPHGSYVAKKQMGWPSVLILPEFYRTIGPLHENPDDETLFTRRLESMGYINFSTLDSYVEHVGQNSLLNNFRPKPVEQADFSYKLIEQGWGEEIKKYTNYSIQRDLRENQFPKSSAVPIDVIIPVAIKDISTLPFTLDGISNNLKHPISSITLISNADPEIMNFANGLGISWIEEREIVSTKLPYRDLANDTFDLSGWLYQQLLKLSCNQIGKEEHKLVMDADLVFLKPQAFIDEEIIYHPFSENYHSKYFQSYSRILKEDPINHTSNISHFMMLKMDHLSALKQKIEKISGVEWKLGIYSQIDLTEPSAFSEFELYAHFVRRYFPNSYRNIIYSMKDLSPRELRPLTNLAKKYPDTYSIGFQQWMK